MSAFDSKQLAAISKIIEKHIGVMMHVATGEGKVDAATLRKFNINPNDADMVQNSFVLGKLVQLLESNELSKVSFDDLKTRAREVSMSAVEKNSLDYARQNAGRYITALGQKMNDQLISAAHHSNSVSNLKAVEHKIVQDATANAILNRQTRDSFVSDLRENTGDYLRDWKRVSSTELWNAKLQGEVVTILQGDAIHANNNGAETRVFRRPAPDACKHCKRLYLETDGVTPRIFTLSELIANGSNIGKTVSEWQPITGTTHPHCTCPIATIPEGFGFNERGELDYIG